jgi:hypothetical protein
VEVEEGLLQQITADVAQLVGTVQQFGRGHLDATVPILYTDGVTEAFDAGRQMFGEQRLKAVVCANARRSAPKILAAVADAVSVHAGAVPQSDDITLLVLRIKS